MKERPTLDVLRRAALLDALDVAFAHAIERLAGEDVPLVALGAALASRAVARGHVCVDLATLAGTDVVAPETDEPELVADLEWPALDAWIDALRASPALASAGTAPLVLSGTRLYLERLHRHERTLADGIRRRAAERPSLEGMDVAASLARLFGTEDVAAPDRQRAAARTALERRFTVVSGGPGTGKTATVVKILALVAERALSTVKRAPRTALLAPTGKAAARLREAIEKARATLDVPEDVRKAIATETMTIHRALGFSMREGERFRHHSKNPLPAELIVVDEASMVDLALMARLLDAAQPHARVVLLGDEHQLASVEAGAVLGDICAAGDADGGADAIAGCVVRLDRSWRYDASKGIGALARAIHAGDPDAVLAVLDDPAQEEVSLGEAVADDELPAALAEKAADAFGACVRAGDPAARLAALDRLRILCAHRRGPASVDTMNAAVIALLRDAGLAGDDDTRFAGRPVLVTKNDYTLGLFNGDVGVLSETPDGRLVACFQTAEGLRLVSPSRLPAHETVFAMSVHKAQGSEVDEVAVVLPPEPSPIVTRELLYTAITRARSRVVVHGTREVIAHAVMHRVERASGLRERLARAEP